LGACAPDRSGDATEPGDGKLGCTMANVTIAVPLAAVGRQKMSARLMASSPYVVGKTWNCLHAVSTRRGPGGFRMPGHKPVESLKRGSIQLGVHSTNNDFNEGTMILLV
jgi:hypothetical protein